MQRLLRESFNRFLRDPVGEMLLTLLFLLGAMSGVFCGPAALLYLWHHSPHRPPTSANAVILQMQRLQSGRRLPAALGFGLSMWSLAWVPALVSPVFGLPLWIFLVQPIWLMLVLADYFDLTFGVAFRTFFYFLVSYPKQAFLAMLLAFLGFAGMLLFGVGILMTFPIFTRALLTFLSQYPRQLAAAVQRAS